MCGLQQHAHILKNHPPFQRADSLHSAASMPSTCTAYCRRGGARNVGSCLSSALKFPLGQPRDAGS